jgi:uncharacterized metal-binding protein
MCDAALCYVMLWVQGELWRLYYNSVVVMLVSVYIEAVVRSMWRITKVGGEALIASEPGKIWGRSKSVKKA